MITDFNDSKEVIKNRMLKHALNYWNIKNTEDLDPVVKLIMEALALELYTFGNEIKDVQVRVLEKVASLLTPDFLISPSPAHAIVQAAPVEPTDVLTKTTTFVAQHKISSRQNEVLDINLDVAFTPVDAVPVFDAQIAFLEVGRSLFGYDASLNRQLIAQASRTKYTENNTLWLGLKINPLIDENQKLYFYFDWKNLEPQLAHRIYQHLPSAQWYLDDQLLTTEVGVPYVTHTEEIDAYQRIFLEYDLLSLIEKDIKQYYHPMFITISDKHFGNLTAQKKRHPASFNDYFNEADLQKLNEPLVWLKVVFPAALQQQFLNEVYVSLNAFPVLNRQVNDLKYRLKGGSHIIPLRTGALDQFLSIISLSDDVNEYKSVPYQKTEEKIGTYTLRYGGVERFDGRNAREMISYLMELLRNESAAFASYGYEFIASTLKEMQQKITLMEQKTKGYINDAAEVPNYVIVKPFEGKDMMYAEYWTTLAEAANNLRSGTKLQPFKNVKAKSGSVSLLTTTTGGKNRLKPEDRLNAFRYGIMTRNRIVTKEDIYNFCKYELGNRLQKVRVEKGVEISSNPKEAFVRTIDIILTPAANENEESEEWQMIGEQIKSKLKYRSGTTNNYRLLIEKKKEA